MAIQEGPDSHNEKGVITRWPVAEGLTAGTNKQKGKKFLNTNVPSLVRSNDKIGIG